MTGRTELRRLLDVYRTAPNTDAAVDAYQEYREAAVNALPSLLDELDLVEADRNDAILYWKDTRDALARQTPHYLAAKAGVERVRELHERESFWQYDRDQEHSYQTQQEAADESGCDCPEVAGSLAGYAHTPECLATITHFDVCAECARIEYADSDRQAHGEFSGYAEALWPCPTIAAIGGEQS